ncbi:MAG: 50S ribosomal protein L19 [Parcubacteria group bacterium]|nr:50S ribosomal protein L19 [Parcubacteria group bacterium]
MEPVLAAFNAKYVKKDLPRLRAGMRVRVWSKIKEGDKWRSVPFEGTLIATKHGRGISASLTVRKIGVNEVGVERTWPLHSPLLERIEILETPKVRRAKQYYLRKRSRRETRAKLKTKKTSSLGAV